VGALVGGRRAGSLNQHARRAMRPQLGGEDLERIER